MYKPQHEYNHTLEQYRIVGGTATTQCASRVSTQTHVNSTCTDKRR